MVEVRQSVQAIQQYAFPGFLIHALTFVLLRVDLSVMVKNEVLLVFESLLENKSERKCSGCVLCWQSVFQSFGVAVMLGRVFWPRCYVMKDRLNSIHPLNRG